MQKEEVINAPVALIGSEGELGFIAPNYLMLMMLLAQGYDVFQLLKFKEKPWHNRREKFINYLTNEFGIERINAIIFGLDTSTLIPYVLFVLKNVEDQSEQNQILARLEGGYVSATSAGSCLLGGDGCSVLPLVRSLHLPFRYYFSPYLTRLFHRYCADLRQLDDL